jgi:hypothetical protein
MQRCPLCRSTRFKPRKARQRAECAWCGALERTRMIALGLDRIPADLPAGPFLHFAPEEALYGKLRRRFGDRYTPVDIDPATYKLFPAPVRRVDIAAISNYVPPGSLAGILHSHLINRAPGDPRQIMADLNAALGPGGVHLFVVGLDEVFDAPRIEELLACFEGFRRLDFAESIQPADLYEAAIPEDALSAITANTLFGFVKL